MPTFVKTSLTFMSLCLMLIGANLSTRAQDNKSNVINAAKAIETNTVTRETISQREAALRWLIETDEVSLIVCGGTFGSFGGKKNKNAPDMTAAYTIGMGAYKLENPDKSNDENAAQLAGLMLALKAYEWAVKDKRKRKNEDVEALIQKRDAGQLAALVNSFDCGRK